MAEQFTITGVVLPVNGVERVGMKVQAFDRDMPSVERLTAPEMLGEATTDAQGSFKITYTLDQFQRGEGSSLFRKPGEKNADLSFRIFARTGQELIIRSIDGNRPVGPDQIIFNAPEQLVVNISVDLPQLPAISEYERFLNLVTPIIVDVPLTRLTDEDVRFILSDLDAAQQGEIPQRIEWLRRCALLAETSNLPVEPFYGWGRKNVPAPILELAAVPLKDLTAVLEKLTSTREDKLRESLLAAIAENIIPLSFRDRVDEIVRLLTRRDQVLHEVVAQLLDVDTKEPLAGYTVTAFGQEDGVGENRGVDITDGEGKFSFAFFLEGKVSAEDPPREFRLEVISPGGEVLVEDGLVAVSFDKPETEPFPAFVKVPRPEVSKQQEAFQSVLLDVPEELRSFLVENQSIQTLADLRRKGGLSQLAGLPVSADPAQIRKLESLADLDRVSSDISVSKTLLDRNFDNVLAIADTRHSEFVGNLSTGNEALSEPDAAKLHVIASAQTQLLNNMLMKIAADNANGFELLNGDGDGVLQQKCGCSDCEAAVSPAAYLSALLDYTLKHVRSDKNKIDLQFLVDVFHQPFIDLPTDCEAVESQLHQVRICIEVLRSYLGQRPLADPVAEATLAKAEADYSFAAYTTLLSRVGSSYEEVRRVRAESSENREAVAERIGLDLTGARPADELDQLFLDTNLLNEESLEKLFGLANTARDPLSEGAKLGDEGQITRWNLNGAVWGQNTDAEGLVHVTLVNPAPAVFRVELHQDLLRTRLIASGEIATANGAVKLVSEFNSSISGVVEIAYTVDSAVISIAAIPAFLSAQLKHLRSLWFQQDHPGDVYSKDSASGLPIIDPDLIGPDDFRDPTPKTNPADPDRAFDIWLQRREFVDSTISGLKADRETKGIAEILRQVLVSPLKDLEELLLVLAKGGTAAEVKAARDSVSALNLSVESFTRLMSIRDKDQLAQSDTRNVKVTEPEWREVYSILAQALKARQFNAWQAAEQAADINLGLEQFWFSVTEPKEGEWPRTPIADQPLIDPDIVKLTDLPEWLAGKKAISLWKARKQILENIPQEFNAKRQAEGSDSLMRLALGQPASGDPLQHDLNTLKENLGSTDDAVRSKATKEITDDFHLTNEGFKRAMEIKAASDQADPAKKPTAADWAELVTILASAHKVKHLYPAWANEESVEGLVYWKALKANLPLWRASVESRQRWQQALRIRSQPPIVDPTVMGADDLQHVIPGDPAFDIWKDRSTRTVVLHDELKTTFEALAPDSLAGLDQIIQDALGFDVSDLQALDQERQSGHSIEKRLDQLDLAAGAFDYLLRIMDLAKATQPITESEFETVYDTLTRARLQREFADMHSQEQDQHVSLTPDFFKVIPTPFSVLSTPRWLSTWQARLDWQDTLQSRIDQESAITEGLATAISAVEEATLPALRDALITASNAVGANLTEQAEWITARLLIDARSGGCRTTTRVAQALETLQTLIFNLRTGQFKQQGATVLSLVSDSFDEEWKWIGSYATWRSAMFVFLYPENILQPGLLKDKSPAFDALITSTRSIRVNPQTACQKAQTYGDYFRDICSLEIQATCQASTVMYTGQGCDRHASNVWSMFYMFARADSGKVYWSAYDAGGGSFASGPTFWKEVEGFEGTKVSRIVGAIPYRKSVADKNFASALGGHGVVQSSYIYLFCISGEADKKALKLVRLSLEEFGKWGGDGTPIELPVPPITFSSLEIIPVQTQNEFSRPGLIFHKFGDSRLYYRLLNADGAEWEQKSVDWSSFFFIYDGSGHIESIQAALRVSSELLWFINTSDSAIRGLELQLIELRPGNKNPGVSRAWSFGRAEFLGALPGPEDVKLKVFPTVNTSAIYVFWRDSSGSHYRRFTNLAGDEANNPVQVTLTDLITVSPHAGSGAAGQQMLAYQREKNARAFYMYKFADTKSKLVGSDTVRAAPRVNAPLNVPLHQSAKDLQQRRREIIDAFKLNADAAGSVIQYLREAYYFVPLHLALALQSAGHYLAALDCFRTVYDYESQIGPPNERNIYFGLELDAKLPDDPLYQLSDDWLLDPLNPHSIAGTRHLTYTRFTIMSLIRCLLDFADSEFTLETGESLAQARTLYLTVLDLLNLPELQQRLGVCDDLIADLMIEPGKDVPAEVSAAVGAIMEELTKAAPTIRNFGKAARDAKAKLQGQAEWSVKLVEARAVVHDAIASAPLPLATGSMVISKSNILKEQHALLLTQPLVDNRLKIVSHTAVTTIFDGLGVNVPVVQPGNGKPLPPPPPQPPVLPLITPSLQFCIPPNPILKALRLHAELNLYKLRTCRNIAGLKRQLDPYAAPTDTTTGMPTIGAGGQLVLPGTATLLPSLYRYPVLIERAKQLAQEAAQIEGGMLSALERRDAEAQTLLQARQQLSLAQAGLRLQDLRVFEANDGVTLAELQQERAQIQIDTYQGWLDTGANEYENDMIFAYRLAALSQKDAADASNSIQAKQSAIASAQLAASLVAADPTGGALAGGVGLLNLGVDLTLFDNLRDATRDAITFTMNAQVASINAALERRKDEWRLQQQLAEQDSQIGEQQQKIANDHVQIATQERAIAGIQADNAKDSVEFLTNKFSNVELFDWLSNVLEGVYSYFLQQATAMATLAGNQLAFERQEVPPVFINSNYWELPTDSGVLGNAVEQATDRHGLTGSARLLQDIYQLDQYAFSTNKRKLPLTKTISLSRLAPVEFQRFRETGVMPFVTSMELFDRGFPGHYLRLIKRVRTSVVALIPPIDGIHATLSTTGPSRVVIGGDVFQTVPIRRGPEFIAMSAPSNSTGVFELDPQPDMLLPFEGSGVEMSWEFKMPRAANRFDYRTIADVLITLEYTALDSVDYRQQVIQTLKPTVTSDRPFSFRTQFADQWYDLHNPAQTSGPMTVRFTTLREDFPPNIEALKIQHVVLYFIGANDKSPEVPVNHLRYTAKDEPGTVGGGATSIDGIISTRRGNAGSWAPMIGKSPIGEWELALPDTEEMRKRFGAEDSDEGIQDILLVVTYSARTPDWPN
jgi:hypothetical protein